MQCVSLWWILVHYYSCVCPMWGPLHHLRAFLSMWSPKIGWIGYTISLKYFPKELVTFLPHLKWNSGSYLGLRDTSPCLEALPSPTWRGSYFSPLWLDAWSALYCLTTTSSGVWQRGHLSEVMSHLVAHEEKKEKYSEMNAACIEAGWCIYLPSRLRL